MLDVMGKGGEERKLLHRTKVFDDDDYSDDGNDD